jgi:hypothetical protein
MKPSSKKVPADKIQRRATDTADESLADRTVARMAAGFNKARRSGKFPKVY